MKAFEYAAPRTEGEVLELLSAERGKTEILAGGTDLIGLMKKFVVTPDRVVSLKDVESLKQIEVDSQGARIGAMATLADILNHPVSKNYPVLRQAIEAISSIQMQSQGTLGGELCQRPRCWYFRNGHGLLAEQMVAEGDNRYHAIFGNAGPAKFVNSSRLAPALIALGATVRVLGPNPGAETEMPLEHLFRTPKSERQRENVLEPNQLVAEIILPAVDDRLLANYEVQHGTGVDYPLVSAAAALEMRGSVVRRAKIVLGQVAPTPWVSTAAAEALTGLSVSQAVAEAAGQAAVASATPLADNEYKVQLAKVAVKRAILLAAGLEHGGL